MAKVYTWRFHVRSYDLGADSGVRLPVYQHYCEEAATQASASNGYSYAWYMEHRRIWVARKTSLHYGQPAKYGDELEMRTWVADYRRVQSHRDYALRRLSDGAVILRGRTNWVYLDMDTMRPQRLPEDFKDAFEPDNYLEPIDTGIADLTDVPMPTLHRDERQVVADEIDSGGIVNNANYVMWAEQAITNMLRAMGWSLPKIGNTPMTTLSHEIEYFRPARFGDTVIVETKVTKMRGERIAWETEIKDKVSGEVFAKDVTVRRLSSLAAVLFGFTREQ